MSGELLPYHLRSNKAIDRAIFMEFLSKLNVLQHIHTYGYIGFGAVHMEDFKLIHSLFSIEDLVCIEIEELIHNRQKFNLPLNCIKLENTSSDSFIARFFPEKNYIIWLDYTSPKQIRNQLGEFHAILQKLKTSDVVKITLNANPNSIIDQKQYNQKKQILNLKYELEDLYEERLDILKQKVDEVPHEITADMMTKKKYPSVLCKILELVSESALENTGKVFYPVLSFVYSDSQNQMLTLTGIVLEKNELEEYKKRLGIEQWEYSCLNWGEPQIIDIPDLTIRERLEIDACLPCKDPKLIISKLNIQFDIDEDKSIEKLKSYIKYYRHYPFFSKVSV